MAKRSNTNLIVVHCSATRPSQDIGRNEIDAWHRFRGFLGIGYHYVIKRDGTVEEGRDQDAIGAHAKNHNHESIGIALVGGVTEEDVNVSEDNFTPEQYAALIELLASLQEQYPDAQILGHRDLPNVRKDCPSFDVKAWLQDAVARVAP